MFPFLPGARYIRGLPSSAYQQGSVPVLQERHFVIRHFCPTSGTRIVLL